MKKSALFFLLSCTFFLLSCTSSIPGAKTLQQKSLYAEYLNLADCYAEIEKYDKAIQYYNLSLQDKSLYWSALYKLALTHVKAKNYAEAEIIYQKLLERDSQNMNLRLSVAYLKAVSGHIDESLALYKILISENEKDETPLVNYIAILIATGRNELAEENLAVLKEKFPESTHISDFEDALK